ncbi:MAG: hypothetical protein R3E44_02605 [Paracoccaceae bacterium]
MQIKRRALMAGATFLLAAATGHVMQRGETISARLRGEFTPPAQMSVLPAVQLAAKVMPTAAPAAPLAPILLAADLTPATAPAMSVPNTSPAPIKQLSLIPTSSTPDEADMMEQAAPAARIEPLPSPQEEPVRILGIACSEAKMTLGATSPALLRLSLAAPCHPDEKVTVRHSGLTIAAMTDHTGSFETLIPTMEEPAVVTADFDAGDSLSETRLVPELSSMTRIAVQWEGSDGFQLSAFEPGGASGAVTRIWDGAPRDRMSKDGGFLLMLGDPDVDGPMLAQVYSAPNHVRVDMLEIAAPVTEGNCGRELIGQIVRIAPDRTQSFEQIAIAMPACSAVGETVALRLAPRPNGSVNLASLGR